MNHPFNVKRCIIFLSYSPGDIIEVLRRPLGVRSFHRIHKHFLQYCQIPAKFRGRHPFQLGNLSPSHQQHRRASLRVLEKLVQA